MVVLLVVCGTATLFLGWRGARRPFHWLALAWAVLLVAQSGALWFFADDAQIVAETLGIELPAGALLLPFDLAFLAAVVLWVARDLRAPAVGWETPRWTTLNAIFLAASIALLPLIFILLRSGEQHGAADQAGVVLTFVQWALLNLAMYPWRLQQSAVRRNRGAGAAA